jgi:hypothetical protein
MRSAFVVSVLVAAFTLAGCCGPDPERAPADLEAALSTVEVNFAGNKTALDDLGSCGAAVLRTSRILVDAEVAQGLQGLPSEAVVQKSVHSVSVADALRSLSIRSQISNGPFVVHYVGNECRLLPGHH